MKSHVASVSKVICLIKCSYINSKMDKEFQMKHIQRESLFHGIIHHILASYLCLLLKSHKIMHRSSDVTFSLCILSLYSLFILESCIIVGFIDDYDFIF